MLVFSCLGADGTVEVESLGRSKGSLQVQLEPLEPGIFLLNLTRPDHRNAIGRQMLAELREAVSDLRSERSTRCVVVRSTSPAGTFSAGSDLKERAAMTQQETHAFVTGDHLARDWCPTGY